MRRLLHAVLVGLLGAAITHVVVLMLVPEFSERDAWSRLSAAADTYSMTRIDGAAGDPGIAKSVDPLFLAEACRFDLTDGMVQVKAPGKVPFWSASVFDRKGQNVYSFNDRSTPSGALDMVVLTPAQMIEVRKELPEDLQGSVFVETPIDEGVVVVRSFVPDESWKPTVSQFLAGGTCETLEL